ncbi:MAG: nicotinate-nucleotide adenylyltransferase [Actinobacteria bacterium]|nr:nicotinate-nucleotide adenylyltransferase [Actinomycetota bacterium]
MRVGLLGGTFDPPHIAHLVVAEWARVALELDEVRFLVAGDPWMKDSASDATHRVAMTELAVADHEAFRVDDRETRREGPTYTAETLEELHGEEPGASWFFLLGADAVEKLPAWHRAADAVALATFVAVGRSGYPPVLDHELLADVAHLDVPHLAVSSTGLRQAFREDGPVRYLVPASVERYIREHGLYRS